MVRVTCAEFNAAVDANAAVAAELVAIAVAGATETGAVLLSGDRSVVIWLAYAIRFKRNASSSCCRRAINSSKATTTWADGDVAGTRSGNTCALTSRHS